ncbi:plasmid mobilization protein [Neokomagataea tanensis]|nr:MULTISPECIES: plasmid mobilization relaxosome protein MobC [Neokomagataea]
MSNLKINSVHFRISDSELKTIKQHAEKRKLKTSQYIRNICLNDVAGGSFIADELLELRKSISPIGNNINQLAHRANSGETVDISSLVDIIHTLQKDINQKLKRVK